MSRRLRLSGGPRRACRRSMICTARSAPTVAKSPNDRRLRLIGYLTGNGAETPATRCLRGRRDRAPVIGSLLRGFPRDSSSAVRSIAVLERRTHEVSGFDAAAALWLRQRRIRIALLIGSAEVLIAFLSSGVIRIAVVVAATPLVGLYLFARTTIEWSLGRQLLWI